MKFELGEVMATKLAVEFVSPEEMQKALNRHVSGDWGRVDPEDAKLNDEAVINGTRILSSYMGHKGTPFWIITEADRSYTTIMLPDEY